MGTRAKFGMSLAVHPEDGTHEKIADLYSTTPGAGTYTPKAVYPNVNSGPRFGRDRRSDMANSATKFCPGPNVYREDAKNSTLRSSASYGFGTSKRPASHDMRKSVPGPGTYAIRSLVGTEV